MLSTAVYRQDREYGEEHYDAETGIVWAPTAGPGGDGMLLDGTWYQLNRCHITAAALRNELESHGLHVLELEEPFGANVICELR